MQFGLEKYNIEKVNSVLSNVKGRTIMVNDSTITGVNSIKIDEFSMYLSDPVPEEDYDGGKIDYIRIAFLLGNGQVVHSFDPKAEHCEIIFETDDLWIFQIGDLKKYIENELFDLQFKLKVYEEYMER